MEKIQENLNFCEGEGEGEEGDIYSHIWVFLVVICKEFATHFEPKVVFL